MPTQITVSVSPDPGLLNRLDRSSVVSHLRGLKDRMGPGPWDQRTRNQVEEVSPMGEFGPEPDPSIPHTLVSRVRVFEV